MSRRRLLLALVVLVALGLWFGLSRVSLSALSEPGRVETYIATQAKRWLVSRSARGPLPPAPPNNAVSVASGRMQYGGRCASCHGLDGRTPTDVGRWMYPRSPDLGSPAVQEWSDAELFWIIKHGIRLSGMPGFGKIHSDEEIWHLVHYVRSLGSQPKD
jgi:mono/diheme cytochrome c family protein